LLQNFDSELAALPGKYAPPHAVASGEGYGQPPAVWALRRFDQTPGEVKRLYVRPQFRGSGLGKALMNTLAADALAIGYSELIADTIPTVMATALAMSSASGSKRITPYRTRLRKRSTSACGCAVGRLTVTGKRERNLMEVITSTGFR